MLKSLSSQSLSRLFAPVLVLAAAGGLGACQKQDPTVTEGWVRLASSPDRPSAAYFTVKGGSDATQLSSVSSQVAIRLEMHETVNQGGMMSMKPVTSVDVPAGGTVKFEPGGKHVMIWNVNPGIKPGARMPMVFTFANGVQIEYPMVVQGAAGSAPAGDAHAGNHSE